MQRGSTIYFKTENVRLCAFETVALLNEYLIRTWVTILQQAIAKRGHAYIAVPGGTSPISFFKKLSQVKILDWNKVTIILTDERLVLTTAVESNERMLKDNLLKDAAADANFISLQEVSEDASMVLTQIDVKIAQLPKFDIVMLGMGEDGHTASLLPNSSEIDLGLSDKSFPALLKVLSYPYHRITLTKMRLLHSRAVYIYLIGEKKYHVLKQAWRENDPINSPIAAFLHAKNTPIRVMYAKR